MSYRRKRSAGERAGAASSSTSSSSSSSSFSSSLSKYQAQRHPAERDSPFDDPARRSDSHFKLGVVPEDDYVDVYAESSSDDDDPEEASQRTRLGDRWAGCEAARKLKKIRKGVEAKRARETTEGSSSSSSSSSSARKKKQQQQQQTETTSGGVRNGVTREKVKKKRALESMSMAWGDDLREDPFARVNKQERDAMMKRNIYLTLETFLRSNRVHDRVVARKRSVPCSIERVLDHMMSRGYRFTREPKALRKYFKDKRKHRDEEPNYAYYRFEDDGTIVLVADADTKAYIGRFYCPLVTPEVVASIERIYNVTGLKNS